MRGGSWQPRTVVVPVQLDTERLVLRPWRVADRAPFAQLNADPRVMEHFPKPLSRAESDAFADRIEAQFAEDGHGLFALERKDSGVFIGFTGLAVPRFEAPFMPAIEIGWRLAFEHWGTGLATEAASRVLRFGFERLGLEEIISMTVPANQRSRRVMEKLHMSHDPKDDFDHPALPLGHLLRRHVLYRRRPHR